MRGLGSRLRGNAGLFWRWFNGWRKRYMWLRLAVVLVVFAPTVYEARRPLIEQLVRYAIQAIETATTPTEFYHARLLRLREAKRLQRGLLARFDADHDGRVSGSEGARLKELTGLSPVALSESALRADYDRLLAASRKVGARTRFGTSREMRRWAYETAWDEAEAERRQHRQEIDDLLKMSHVGARGYLRWETWARGLGMFRDQLGWMMLQPFPAGLAGVTPDTGHRPGAWEPWAVSRRYVGWLIVAVVIAISMRRFGQGEVRKRRLQEGAGLSAAPCPVCGEAADDAGAVREQRLNRAVAAGAVVALVTFAVVLSVGMGAEPEWARGSRAPMLAAGVLGLVTAIIRWMARPWEARCCHRRPGLQVVGIAASAIAVAAPLVAIVLAYARVSR